MAVDIRKLRTDIKHSGRTQTEIARLAGYKKSAISLLVRGRADGYGPSMLALRAVAAVLGFRMARYIVKRKAAK